MKQDPRLAQRDTIVRLMAALEKAYLKVVARALDRVARKFTQDLTASKPIDALELERLRQLWQEEVPELADAALAVYLAGQEATVRRFVPGTSPRAQLAADFLEDTTGRLSGVGESLATAASNALAAGVREGEGYGELRNRLLDAFAESGGQLGEGRAMTIARTEVHEAWQRAAFDVAHTTPAARTFNRQWVATVDERTRPDHWDADGQVVPLDQPFSVGGEDLQYPGDPDGSPEQTICCRCVAILVEGDAPLEMENRQYLSDEELERIENFFAEGGEGEVAAGGYSPDVKLTAAAHGTFTGAIVALIPSEQDAQRLALEGYEPPEEMHCTLSFLGDVAGDGEPAPAISYEDCVAAVEKIVAGGGFDKLSAFEAPAFAYAVFNPGDSDPDRTPATVLLLQAQELLDLREAVVAAVGTTDTFPCYFPHLTLGYDVDPALADDLAARVGPVLFDRVRVAYGSDQTTDIPLSQETTMKVKDKKLDGEVIIEYDEEQLTFPTARIRALTIVDIPAFSEARIRLDGPPDADGLQRWVSDPAIAYVGKTTGDGRTFEEMTWTEPPMPLRWAREDQGWHFGAVVVGRVDEIGMANETDVGAAGVIDTTIPEGAAVAALIERELCSGVSVDMDDGEEQTVRLIAAMVGDLELPIAARDAEWDGGGAASRALELATDGDGNVDADVLARAFLYRDDSADPTTLAAYKLGFADVVDGTLTIIPTGVFACAGSHGVDAADIPTDEQERLRSRVCGLYGQLAKEFDDDTIVCPFDSGAAQLEASAWSAMREEDPLPAAWFTEPENLPQDKGAIFVEDGRVFGWVARAGVPHEVLGVKPPLRNVDLSHFLRHEMELDDGRKVAVGALTMDVGHHRDGAECETASCQFDDTRTVAGIVTVGINKGGMWFSGASAPWLSSWDRKVFRACQLSGHWRQDRRGRWALRAILSVPVPAYSTPLVAGAAPDELRTLAASVGAVVHRSNAAITAAAAADEEPPVDEQPSDQTLPDVEEAVSQLSEATMALQSYVDDPTQATAETLQSVLDLVQAAADALTAGGEAGAAEVMAAMIANEVEGRLLRRQVVAKLRDRVRPVLVQRMKEKVNGVR